MASRINVNGKRPAEDSSQVSSHAFECDFKKIITVIVGSSEEEFVVHQDIICTSSQFFHAACSSPAWIEAQSKQVRLSTHTPGLFRTYLKWIYRSPGTLFDICRETYLKDHASKDAPSDEVKVRTCACLSLCQLWMHADSIGDSACKNEVINNLVREHAAETFSYLFLPQVGRMIYNGTAKGSALRKWLIDSLVPTITAAELDFKTEVFVPEMLSDIIKAFIGGKAQTQFEVPKISEVGKYHE